LSDNCAVLRRFFSEQRENLLSMTSLLVKNTCRISTDGHQRELPEGGLFARFGNV
jgi:hypothetical protein